MQPPRALPAPPRVTKATPRWPVSLAVASAIIDGPALVPADNGWADGASCSPSSTARETFPRAPKTPPHPPPVLKLLPPGSLRPPCIAILPPFDRPRHCARAGALARGGPRPPISSNNANPDGTPPCSSYPFRHLRRPCAPPPTNTYAACTRPPRLYGPDRFETGDLRLPLYDADWKRPKRHSPPRSRHLAVDRPGAEAVVESATPDTTRRRRVFSRTRSTGFQPRVKGNPWADKPVAIMSAGRRTRRRANGRISPLRLMIERLPGNGSGSNAPDGDVGNSSPAFSTPRERADRRHGGSSCWARLMEGQAQGGRPPARALRHGCGTMVHTWRHCRTP